jgi:hypothetical protein
LSDTGTVLHSESVGDSKPPSPSKTLSREYGMEHDCSNSNIEEEEGRRRMETREERGDSLGGEAEEEDVENLSIPRGGPIYVPNLVGPLLLVPQFRDSLHCQLQVAIF